MYHYGIMTNFVIEMFVYTKNCRSLFYEIY